MSLKDFLKKKQTQTALRYGKAIKNVLRRRIEDKLDESERRTAAESKTADKKTPDPAPEQTDNKPGTDKNPSKSDKDPSTSPD